MILKPDYNVVSLFDIPFEELKNQGIKALLFDLDSTVMPSKSGKFPENVVELLKKLQEDFSIAIISNNKRKEYLEKVSTRAFFPVIGCAGKPNPKIMKEFLKSINIEPKNAVMIGDRPLTDILAGKLAGTKTVLVDSITKDTENKLTRFVRQLERLSIRN